MNESIWISELVREIGNRIARKMDVSPELVHAKGAPTVRRFSITQRFSTDAASTGETKSLIAKTRRFASKSAFADAVEEPRTQRLAEQEYETHRKAVEIFSAHESMSVPDLFDLQTDLATIVMEAVPGESLANSVSSLHAAKNLFTKRDLQAQFSRAGAWLRIFHEGIAEQERVKWKRDAVDGIVASHLDSLRNDGVGQSRYDNVASRFDRRLDENNNLTSHVFGTIHGDYKPAHVLLNEQQMVVIDFGTTRTEYGAADAGNFLADLSCNAYGPRLVSRSRLEKLATGFSAGYNGSDGSDSLINLYCGVNLLRLWRKRRQRFPNGTPLRKIDRAIDLSKSRGLLNRAYVDNWFERTIINVLSSSSDYQISR